MSFQPKPFDFAQGRLREEPESILITMDSRFHGSDRYYTIRFATVVEFTLSEAEGLPRDECRNIVPVMLRVLCVSA